MEIHMGAFQPGAPVKIDGITYQIEILTPDRAELLLKNNPNNRNLNKPRARALSHAILRGEWDFNGDAIRVSMTGELMDGQHRCAGIVMAGIGVPVLMVYGIGDSAMLTMDIGAKRTLANMLQVRGFKDTAQLANTGGWLFRFLAGPTDIKVRAVPTPTQLVDILDAWPGLYDSVRAYGVLSFRQACGNAPRAPLAALHTLTSREFPQQTEDFAKQMTTGIGACTTVATMRSYYSAIRGDDGPLRTRQGAYASKSWYSILMAVKSWNAFISGRDLTRLTYRGGPFPEIIGGVKWANTYPGTGATK